MTLTIPNLGEGGASNDQAAPDSRDFEAIVAGFARSGVLSGCAVSQRAAGANMSVDVAAGLVSVAGTPAAVAGGNLAVGAADPTNPRFDLVVVNAAGAASIVAGTPAASTPTNSPHFPSIPAASVVLAAVYVPALAASVTTALITDKRVVVTGLGLAWRGAWTASTQYAANDLVTNNGGVYLAPISFVSGLTFNAANWTVLVSPTGTYALSTTPQTVENTAITTFSIQPVTAGFPKWQIQENSFSNPGAGAGTYNHGVWVGWNSGRHAGGAVTAGKRAIFIGLEDNYFDSGGDNQYAGEFYVEGWSPDGTTVQMSRPYYARGAQENDGTDWWTIISNIGSSTASGGQRQFTVRAGSTNLFSVGPTGITLAVNTTQTANVFGVQPASGQATIYLNSPVVPKVQYQVSGSPVFSMMAASSAAAQLWDDVNSRVHALYTLGSSITASKTEFKGQAIVDGSLIVGTAALATNATDGFVYIPTCAGTPTGTPSAKTGTVPLVFDSTNRRLYVYESAAWHYFGETA